jgi:hypothetical protein
MLGWDISGSLSTSINGNASLSISVQASTQGGSLYVLGLTGGGYYELNGPIQFFFGTPFELTVNSGVFAAVGYDYTNTTPSEQFSAFARAEFLHTAVLSTAAVSDSGGTELTNFTITTSSGRNFPVQVPEPGDYNRDGNVDAADYVVWRKQETIQADYNTWRANFGRTVGNGADASANGTVPEPATLVMLMFAATAWCLGGAGPHRKSQQLITV